MDTLTRRRFLIGSGVVGGAALLAGSAGVTWAELAQRASETPIAPGSAILVLVTMYGGNDGINTVIPYADPAYHDARPELAYAPGDVLHLDDTLGLNPAMKGMAELWQRKNLAIVRGAGYPQPDHSHFRSMDIWQTASPSEPYNTGWLGRWLDATGDDPVRAVNIGAVLPPLAVGNKSTAAALPLGKTTPLAADLATALHGLGGVDAADSPFDAMVCASYRAERTVASAFTPALDPNAQAPDHTTEAKGGSGGGQQGLAEQLDLVARCIKVGVPTKAYAVSLGGFDTHADERGTQQALLGALDGAVSKFLSDMAGDPRGKNVVLVAYSEFGRRVQANASQGTDHGTAGPVFVAGQPVKGGFYGAEPSLTDLDNGDLRSDVDFRSIYGEMLHRVLDADPQQILGGSFPELGLLRT